ncbi:calcium/sodium antiporter [Phycisphaera mikurensis]|uniref:Putative transporter n=1 Tax=Phycisphaera mikurensis (strain NBRC 102666 / KCTC 22515 / FYK2301M01) TaxID=1142394 RepID=I0II26_PHYMF|nr:calcium/sodium antiporter [Phycisphaera mikurensis]MBB6442522.1 cation:H+ antiporter [Phycisphaera mikurensis]BAM04914.1 putative transporter [Phycisphaera mikurensis NBRC 102666]
MLLSLTLLGLGLALLLAGGEALVRGAVAAAERLGVPTLVIGLTVVAFGTSTPELVVSLGAAWRGSPDLTFGNVVGSNLANVTLLLGLTALVKPVLVERRIVRREVPLMLLTAAAAAALALDGSLGSAGAADAFSRGDGLVLLLLFAVYLYGLLGDALGEKGPAGSTEAAAKPPASGWLALGLIALGLVGLIAGGELTVRGATDLARAAGLPEVVIALTVVAVGTSLPELVTCLAAARRGQSDLVVGNLVGSNLYNLTFVLGLTAAAVPVPVPVGGGPDLLAMVAVSALLLPLALTGKRVSRPEGALLLALFGGYTLWRVAA